jgi:putative hydrolase of HD superfamily
MLTDEDIVDSVIDSANEISGQAYVVRYNGKPTLHRQNLYEHHGSVAQLLLLLFKVYDVPEFEQLNALKRALTHDLPEIWLADIPFNTHVDNPHFSEAYDNSEQKILNSKLDKFDYSVSKYSRVWHLVKAADCLDVVLFCKQEFNLGNKSDTVMSMYKQDVELAAKHLRELDSNYARFEK